MLISINVKFYKQTQHKKKREKSKRKKNIKVRIMELD